MTALPSLTMQAARNLSLEAQGLLEPPTSQATKADLMSVIYRIHALQIDTINIVARAPYHILWSRLGDYDPAWLEELHAEGALFEYWAHAACFLPIEDYALYRRKMLDDRHGWKHIDEWGEKNQATLKMIRAHLQDNGAVKSSNFKAQKKGSVWWDWKVEKMALEYLFFKGEVMIARREKFQRVYDLRERVLPDWDDGQVPTHQAVMRRQVLDAVKAIGIAREDWVAPYFYLPKIETQEQLQRLLNEGKVFQVEVQGLNNKPFYVHADSRGAFESALAGKLDATHTTILSPFDPLITDRARLKALFDFDYLIECYTPAAKRIYGYFTLPILQRGRIIGRVDAKAWRKEQRLEVISLYLEPEIVIDDQLLSDLRTSLQAYAHWQNLHEIRIQKTEPAQLKELLQ